MKLRKRIKQARGGDFSYWGIAAAILYPKTQPRPRNRGEFPGVNIDAVHKGRK